MIAATCEVWIDGKRVADGQPAEPANATVALSGLALAWGRGTNVDQPSPSQLTFDLLDPAGGDRFDTVIRLGSTVVVWAQFGADRRPVFAGRVTDLDAGYDDATDSAICSVIVGDAVADLANRFVGAEPWGGQYLYARVDQILGAVGNPVAAKVNTALNSAWLVLSRMDVDRQAAQGLLYDVAVSGGLVLWSGVDSTGKPILIFEDPTTRPSQSRFLPYTETGTPWSSLAGPWSGLPGKWSEL